MWLDFWPQSGKFHAQSHKVCQKNAFRQWSVGRKRTLTCPWPHERSKINLIVPGISGEMVTPFFIFILSQGHVSSFLSLATICRVETKAQHILVNNSQPVQGLPAHKASLDPSDLLHLGYWKEFYHHGPGNTQKMFHFQMEDREQYWQYNFSVE